MQLMRYLSISPDFTIDTDLLHLSFELVPMVAYGQVCRERGRVSIRISSQLDFSQPRVQTGLSRIVTEELRTQCRLLLPERLYRIAQTAGVSGFRRITFKNITSRWGSCSSLKNLNFSIWLLLLPSNLIDYVFCHELAHLTHLNHSPAFWTEVDRIMGKSGAAKRADRDLHAVANRLFSREG